MSADGADLVGRDVAGAAVGLVIPARDERENIAAVLASLPAGLLRRVVVVDNGSVDGTGDAARAGGAEVVREPRVGYGSACLAGLAHLAATGPPAVVAFLDADLADDPCCLGDVTGPVVAGEADLVIGSRVALAEPGALTAAQRVGNALACALIGWLAGGRYSDLGPMRAVRWSSLEGLGMRDRTWGWTVEMQYKASAAGLRVREVSVPYRRRRAGVSKISGSLTTSVRAGVKIVATIAALWWASARGGRRAGARSGVR